MALHGRYAVTVSAAVAMSSRADCSSMEDRRGNKRPYQPKHSLSTEIGHKTNPFSLYLYGRLVGHQPSVV